MDWRQIWEVVSTPDNVPIVALLFLVPFYTWYAFRQAIANDQLIAILGSDPALAKSQYRKTAAVGSEVGARSSHLAVPDAHGIPGSHHHHRHPDGLVAHTQCASRRAFQSQRHHESGEGPLVFPRPAGNARLFRSLDCRRGHADADHRRPHGRAVHRHQSARQRLLHLSSSANSPSGLSWSASSACGS